MVSENFSFSFGKIKQIFLIKKEGDKPSFIDSKSSYFSCLIIFSFSTMRFSAQRGGLRLPDSQFSMVRKGIKRSSDILFCVKPAVCRASFMRSLIHPSSFQLSPANNFVASRYCDDKSRYCDDKSRDRDSRCDLLHFIRMTDIMKARSPFRGRGLEALSEVLYFPLAALYSSIAVTKLITAVTRLIISSMLSPPFCSLCVYYTTQWVVLSRFFIKITA